MGLVCRAGRLNAAKQGIDGQHTLRGRGGALLVVGEHAARDAAPISAHVELQGLLNLVGLKPARLSSGLNRPGLGLFPVDLSGRLCFLAVDLGDCEKLGVHLEVLGSAERKRLYLAGLGIEAYVSRRVVHAVLIGRRVHVVRPDFLGLVGHARLGVDEEGQVGPLLAELFVICLLIDDIPDPGKEQRIVRTGTNRQPHVGLCGLGGHVGVDDDGLDAQIGARIRQAVPSVGRFGGMGLAPPQHEDALGVVDAALGELGCVHDAHPALGGVHVDAAVKTHATTRHEIARHGALARTARKRVATTERRVNRAGLPLNVSSAAATGMPVRVGTVLLDSRGNLRAGQIDCLVPADSLPLVLPAHAHTLHGVQHVTRAVHSLELREALEADAALVEGPVRVSLNFHHDPVLGVHDHRAAIAATVTSGLVLLPRHRLVGKSLRGLLQQWAARNRKGRSSRSSSLQKRASRYKAHVCTHTVLLF